MPKVHKYRGSTIRLSHLVLGLHTLDWPFWFIQKWSLLCVQGSDQVGHFYVCQPMAKWDTLTIGSDYSIFEPSIRGSNFERFLVINFEAKSRPIGHNTVCFLTVR